MRCDPKVLILVILWAAMAGTACPTKAAVVGEIRISSTAVVGERSTLTVELDGEPLADVLVVAVYRPGSQLPETEQVGATSVRGTLDWTPRAGGLVRLRAVDLDGRVWTKDVGVYFPRFPRAGLVVLIVAGALLAGGALSQVVSRLREVRGVDSVTR